MISGSTAPTASRLLRPVYRGPVLPAHFPKDGTLVVRHLDQAPWTQPPWSSWWCSAPTSSADKPKDGKSPRRKWHFSGECGKRGCLADQARKREAEERAIEAKRVKAKRDQVDKQFSVGAAHDMITQWRRIEDEFANKDHEEKRSLLLETQTPSDEEWKEFLECSQAAAFLYSRVRAPFWPVRPAKADRLYRTKGAVAWVDIAMNRVESGVYKCYRKDGRYFEFRSRSTVGNAGLTDSEVESQQLGELSSRMEPLSDLGY